MSWGGGGPGALSQVSPRAAGLFTQLHLACVDMRPEVTSSRFEWQLSRFFLSFLEDGVLQRQEGPEQGVSRRATPSPRRVVVGRASRGQGPPGRTFPGQCELLERSA